MNSNLRATNSGGPDISKTMMPEAREDFVQTESVKSISRRALAYINAGYSVHFRGPAGTGKTTMAMHTAALLGRPVVLITGDEEMITSNLVGAESGYNYRKVTDNYIHTVSKIEESSDRSWNDHRLTTACREGYTLIYDEFTRSRAEANNVLLSVLEEGILVLPAQNRGEPFIKVHPNFRVIFTSNPQEYAGVHEAQDALSDRIVTIDIGEADRELEVSIASSRSGLEVAKTEPIVDMVRAFRDTGEYDQTPTLRACIVICRMVANEKLNTTIDDPFFVQICLDVLGSKSTFGGKEHDKRTQQRKLLLDNLKHYCPSKVSTKPSAKDDESKSTLIQVSSRGSL
ncbi:gas vesicle protein GvpN [Octadecabacter antarcticus 307]|uniref:Gas vesicle protein GvpN n=1 Tax=Octadecabacter antarcticus 307 TaxID=391626 RepID=M9R9U0_9RHOB|nr:gas vesicle protein GvpN [Octadecabacter antarcticus]AGI68578.1 gas vesicle protein GvpN [Octadecabacter antarcticus 307]